MKVRFMFDFAGNIYDWYSIWSLPFFPRVGESIALLTFFENDNEFLENIRKISFSGVDIYDGLSIDLDHLLYNSYSMKIININWQKEIVEVEIANNQYNSDRWIEKQKI